MKHRILPSEERGTTQFDWLESKHTFSFGAFQDPDRMGFGCLVALNDDQVSPGGGFDEHPHSNMEILTIPLAGELVHQDSLGQNHIIGKGSAQLMSAGTGISHSEHNNSKNQPVHFLQIWIQPAQRNLEPSYQQCDYSQNINEWKMIAHPNGQGDGLSLQQEAFIYLGEFNKNGDPHYKLKNEDHGVFVMVLSGKIVVEGSPLEKGDASTFEGVESVQLEIRESSIMLLVEVPLDESPETVTA